MATRYSPKIVTDGLEALVDPANTKSYPGTGTAVTDLKLRADWTITNATFDTDHFVFDAAGEYIQKSDTPSNLEGDPAFTVMQAIRRTGTITGGAPWGIGGGSQDDGFGAYQAAVANTIGLDLWGRTTYRTTATYPLDTWAIVTWTHSAGILSASTMSIWINDTEYTGGDLTQIRYSAVTPTVNNNGLAIGKTDAISTNYYVDNADIGITMFYSKVLSDAEIMQNFNALKGRYGI